MGKNRLIGAIDLGSTKITTLIGQIDSDPLDSEKNINIVGAFSSPSFGIKKGQIVDIEETVEAVISSVEASERMAGYNLSSAFVSLGGATLKSQNSHGVVAVSGPDSEITKSDIDRAIDAASAVSLPASREVIHVLPTQYIVDGEPGVKDPIGMSGVRLEVDTHIVSASTSAVKNLKKAVNEVGVVIEEIVFSGLASSGSVVTSTEKELGCVLIDIGGGTTSIAAFIDGALSYSGVIPIGAKNVTNDLAIGLRVALETAEKIKIVLSTNKNQPAGRQVKEGEDEIPLESLGISEIKKVSKKTLLEGIIRPRLNEIFTMVKLELDKEGIGNRIPSGAIVTGGGALTAGVIDSAKRMLSLPVRIGTPGGISGLIDDILTPAFATPIGLLIHGAYSEPKERLTSIGKKLKLPKLGIFGKIIDNIRDLLP